MKRHMQFAAFLVCLAVLPAAGAKSGASPNQDPTALALVNQALSLLNGGTALSDVTLQANVTYTAGSDIENGTATLEALGNEQSRVVLNLDGGPRQEIRKRSFWGLEQSRRSVARLRWPQLLDGRRVVFAGPHAGLSAFRT